MIAGELAYKEGDWFAVPLWDSGYALGLVARRGKKGGIVLGYFFGPPKKSLPSAEDTNSLTPADAVLIRQFCDPGLVSGEWPVVFRPTAWHRGEWPQPAFGHIDVVDSGKAYRREYEDANLGDLFTHETEISPEEARRLPQDGLSGHIALQLRLSQLLSKPAGLMLHHRQYNSFVV